MSVIDHFSASLKGHTSLRHWTSIEGRQKGHVISQNNCIESDIVLYNREPLPKLVRKFLQLIHSKDSGIK